MKYLFIANPVAGKGKTKKVLPKIKNVLDSKNIEHLIVETKAPGDIEKIISQFENDFDRIIIVGGDGTLHELLNSNKIDGKTFGVIPTGSGNDFAMTLRLKKKIEIDIETILLGKTLSLDIGYVEIEEFSGKKFTKIFGNSFGIGFDAEVANEARKIKIIRGIFLYLLSVFKVLLFYKPRKIEIKSTHLNIKDEIFMISIGNGKTAGGGFRLTPYGNPIDGKLDICIVHKISKFKVLRILPLAIFGKHVTNKSVSYVQENQFEIISDAPVYVHADGEILTDNLKRAKVVVLNNKARFLTNGVSYVNEKA